MPEREGYVPGVPCWVDTSQPDPEAAADFYAGLFGWELEDTMPPGSEGSYFIARCETRAWSLFDSSGEPRRGEVAAVRSIPDGAPSAAAWNTYIWVESADETASKVRGAGGRVLIEPYDAANAGRMARFTDPEGAAFWVLEARQHKGAGLVNDPGSLNFNGLNTRDAERAKAFYASVFAWGTFVMDGAAEMFTLSGYGDFVESHHPGLRERWAEAGAQPGFEDVVATINPIADDQPDTPPHWSVTFAVEDTDVAAGKAAELGGRVIVPPFDAPWTRMTVIADPQGATFIASRFTPENRELTAPQLP
ncbi:MAG TPA: VOC family protein [Solirubrobacterales bacterium]